MDDETDMAAPGAIIAYAEGVGCHACEGARVLQNVDGESGLVPAHDWTGPLVARDEDGVVVVQVGEACACSTCSPPEGAFVQGAPLLTRQEILELADGHARALVNRLAAARDLAKRSPWTFDDALAMVDAHAELAPGSTLEAFTDHVARYELRNPPPRGDRAATEAYLDRIRTLLRATDYETEGGGERLSSFGLRCSRELCTEAQAISEVLHEHDGPAGEIDEAVLAKLTPERRAAKRQAMGQRRARVIASIKSGEG